MDATDLLETAAAAAGGPVTLAIKLAQYVPGIVRLLSGDKAGDAAQAVVGVAEAVTGVKGQAAVDAIAADPQKVMDFQLAMSQQQATMDMAYLADTQSARMRDVDLAKAGMKNYRANALAAAAGFLVLFCLCVIVWASDLNEYAKGGVTLILGRALGWIEQVFSFEFGTTRANKTKDDTINNLSR